MNITIVTVYNSENCGSYLQAYAMSKYLAEKGNNVRFLKRPSFGSSHSSLSILNESIKCAIRKHFGQIRLILQRHQNFNAALKDFNVVSVAEAKKNTDMFLLGSDTIWDFTYVYFRKNYLLYTGKVLGEKKFAVYAASCANTTTENIKTYSIDMSGLKKAKGISVRDRATHDVLYNCVGLESQIVVDPTLLIEKEEYQSLVGKPIVDRYVLVYCFGRIDEPLKNEITMYAKKNELKIITLGSYEKWAYRCIPASPQAFLTYYNSAECVITNTFHGTIFSTIYHRQFLAVTSNKNKITEYLNATGLAGRICDKPEIMAEVMHKKIDYVAFDERLSEIRNVSRQFLANTIKQ